MVDLSPSKRHRGILLSPRGWERLQSAQRASEISNNSGKSYSLDHLSELTGLSTHTLMKVRHQKIPVDRQTLNHYFKAFKLTLTLSDYLKPNEIINDSSTLSDDSEGMSQLLTVNSEIETAKSDVGTFRPEGQIPLDSALYIERPPAELDGYQAIVQPGSLIRVKAPRRMGKTSLMVRILNHAAQAGCQTVFLSLQLADQTICQDLSKFLQWFSANVGRELGLPNQLEDYWDNMFGSKMSCKIYFEQYLIAHTNQPIALALDDVDRLFKYPDVADEFFGLLRTWHEEAKNRDIWKRLRLVIGHATAVYIPLNVNRSPFNVGLPIELKPFTLEQVEALAARYGLACSRADAQQLMLTTNGYPYLVQLALHSLREKKIPLETLLQTATKAAGIYGDHLQRQYWMLEKEPELTVALTQVLKASQPISLEMPLAFKLESMGLVKLQGNQVAPHCALYNQYFRDRLGIT